MKNKSAFFNTYIIIWLIFLSVASLTFRIKAQEELETGAIITDRYGFEMVYVSGDIFEMGIERDVFRTLLEEGLYPEFPPALYDQTIDLLDEQGVFDTAQVEVSPFFIDRYEVTVAQYAEVFEGCLDFGICTEIVRTDNDAELNASTTQPQVGVTWYNAQRFCIARGMRLPTEAEWEYAARGPEGNIFPWGNVFVPEYIVSIPDATATAEVGTHPENVSWVGVYDLVGNAGEWVEDRPVPYSNEIESQFDQRILDTHRVIRGGTYSSNLIYVNSIARGTDAPHGGGGFRCVSSAP